MTNKQFNTLKVETKTYGGIPSIGIPCIGVPNKVFIDNNELKGVISLDIRYRIDQPAIAQIEVLDSAVERELECETELFVTLNGIRYKLIPV